MYKNVSARDAASLVLRLGLGIIFLLHGWQKITKDGGTSWEPLLGTPVQVMVAWTEFLAAILLLAGLVSRFAALAIGCVMLGALYVVGLNRPFVGQEFGAGASAFEYLKVGTEYNFALVVQCAAILLLGSGGDFLTATERDSERRGQLAGGGASRRVDD